MLQAPDIDTELRNPPPARVAVVSDSHAYAVWSRAELLPNATEPYELLQQTVANIAESGPWDAFIVLSDFAMVDCAACVPGTFAGQPMSAGDANDIDEMRARYQMALGNKGLGPAMDAAAQTILIPGDHELKAWEPWYDDALTVALERDAWTTSRKATIGSLRVVYAHQEATQSPTGPEDWTTDVWTIMNRPCSADIVFAEHLVGGISDPDGGGGYWKGRGAAAQADLGDQVVLHAAMVSNGIPIWFSAQDHLATVSQADGVIYIQGGRASGIGHQWADEDWYREAMTEPGDPAPLYDMPGKGTREPGFWEILAWPGRVECRYRRTSLGAGNLDVLLEVIAP